MPVIQSDLTKIFEIFFSGRFSKSRSNCKMCTLSLLCLIGILLIYGKSNSIINENNQFLFKVIIENDENVILLYPCELPVHFHLTLKMLRTI